MNRRQLAPAAFFIAAAFGAGGAPRNAQAMCHTGQYTGTMTCCDSSQDTQQFRCDDDAIGIELVVDGSRTLCGGCEQEVVVETYQAGSATCGC